MAAPSSRTAPARCGIPRSAMSVMGYWRQGKPEHNA
jgi:NADPH-dependent ferric siderophore reductase